MKIGNGGWKVWSFLNEILNGLAALEDVVEYLIFQIEIFSNDYIDSSGYALFYGDQNIIWTEFFRFDAFNFNLIVLTFQ